MNDERQARLGRLLDPKSIAIVGASENPAKFGARPLIIMAQQGFGGRIYPVNPSRRTINGLQCYPDLESLPEVPDVVVVALPSSAVLETVEAAGSLGVGAAVIYSSGFAETGTQGDTVQTRLARSADESGLLLLGPNCQGVATFQSGASSNFASALLDVKVRRGSVAVISQSGMMGGQIFRGLQAQGVGLSHLVASGNEVDLTGSEIAGYLANVPEVSVILLVIEGMREGARFTAAAEACAQQGKRLAVLKTGRAPEAAAAAQSHTAAMAVDGAVFDAVCRRLGVMQATDLDELIGIGVTLSANREWTPRAGTLIISNSGGMGAIMADTAVGLGLELHKLGGHTAEAAGEVLPGFVSAQNPLDMSVLALEDPEGLGHLLEAAMHDPGYGNVQLFIGAHYRDPDRISAAILKGVRASTKPLMVTWRGGDPSVAVTLRDANVPTFSDPTRSLQTAAALTRSLIAEVEDGAPIRVNASVVTGVQRPAVDSAGGADWGSHWDEEHGEVFAAHGVSSLPTRVAATADDAAKFAAEMGYPVALKLSSPARTHKTDFGGLRLGLSNEGELRQAYHSLSTHLAIGEALIVQRMAPAGSAEIFAAIRRDPTFGPVALVGTGGVRVELWDDAYAVMLPVDGTELRRGLQTLRCWPELQAFRGQAGRDITGLLDAVCGLGDLFLTLPGEIETLEVNPLLVGATGEGAWVADWRCDFRPDQTGR